MRLRRRAVSWPRAFPLSVGRVISMLAHALSRNETPAEYAVRYRAGQRTKRQGRRVPFCRMPWHPGDVMPSGLHPPNHPVSVLRRRMDRKPPQAAAGPPASGPGGRATRGGSPVSPRDIARALDPRLRRRDLPPPPSNGTSAAKSRRTPIWAIAVPVLLLALAGAGSWMLWKPKGAALPPVAAAVTAAPAASPQMCIRDSRRP